MKLTIKEIGMLRDIPKHRLTKKSTVQFLNNEYCVINNRMGPRKVKIEQMIQECKELNNFKKEKMNDNQKTKRCIN